MANSKFNPNVIEPNVMPGPVMNVMLGYEDKDPVPVSTGPLVPTLFNSVKARKLRDFRALLAAAVNGKPDEARALLDKDDSLGLEQLLEEKEVVISRTSHPFRLSPYQAALAVKDMQMAALIRSYCKDEKEADRQKNEQEHPKQEVIDAEQKRWERIFKQRDKLLRTIRDRAGDITLSGAAPNYIATEKKDSPVAKELAEFYRLLDATYEEVITPGKRPFNLELYAQAVELYDAYKTYKEYFGGRWDDPRALFFVQKVAGYEGMQRYLPVDTIQAHQEWLSDTVEKLKAGVDQARGTEFKVYRPDGTLEGTVDVYPIRVRGTPGFNFMILGGGAAAALLGLRCRAGDFEAYVNQKQQPNRTYAATPTLEFGQLRSS